MSIWQSVDATEVYILCVKAKPLVHLQTRDNHLQRDVLHVGAENEAPSRYDPIPRESARWGTANGAGFEWRSVLHLQLKCLSAATVTRKLVLVTERNGRRAAIQEGSEFYSQGGRVELKDFQAALNMSRI